MVEPNMLANARPSIARRWLLFGAWIVAASLLFARPLIALVHLSLSNADASHLLVIPFLTAGLLFIERHAIFKHPSFSAGGGIFLFMSVIIVLSIRLAGDRVTSDLLLSSNVLAVLLLWTAGFA